MKEKIQEFYNMLKLDRQNSEWSKSNSLEFRHGELLKEVIELGEAIKNNDFNNIKEEMGDVLWDLLFLMVIAEEKNLFMPNEVIEDAINKLKRRKPWIFTGEKFSKEQESELWRKIKETEKRDNK